MIKKFLAWRERKYWERVQFEHLRSMIQEDYQWVGLKHPVANLLTKRYHAAISKNWQSLVHVSSSTLRDQIAEAAPDYRAVLKEFIEAFYKANMGCEGMISAAQDYMKDGDGIVDQIIAEIAKEMTKEPQL
jgi:hypothetical protein